MNKKNFYVLAVLVILSCKKDNGDPDDSELPVISVTSPTNGQVFASGQSVIISGFVTDNTKVRTVHLEIINSTTGAFIAHDHFSPEGGTFTINRTFSVQASTGYKIKVEAEDRARNISRAEVNITSN
jgi:hypothetical protein